MQNVPELSVAITFISRTRKNPRWLPTNSRKKSQTERNQGSGEADLVMVLLIFSS